MKLATLMLIAASICSSCFADDHACTTDEIVVTATDEYGAFVPNLGPTNFQAEFHSRALPILSSAWSGVALSGRGTEQDQQTEEYRDLRFNPHLVTPLLTKVRQN